MKKKESVVKLLSRRRLAVRRILIASAVYVLITYFVGFGILFPSQSLYMNEELMGTGRTHVIARYTAPEIYKTLQIYFSENEHVTMLSGTHLTYLGWMDAFGVPVDCSKEAPMYAGQWWLYRQDKGYVLYIFGRVDDPEIAYVEVEMQYEAPPPPGGQGSYRLTAHTVSSQRSEWIEKNGRSYFLIRELPEEWPYEFSIYPAVVGYNADGTEVIRLEDIEGASSYYG